MESHYLKLRSDANDNDDINEVVKVWIERSKNIALKDVPYEIFEVIGSYFPPQQNWKKFAACLGVSNLHELRTIEGDSYVKQIWPSELLLQYCADNLHHTFSDVLMILHRDLRRLDCLQELHDSNYVSGFLQKKQYQEKFPINVDHKANKDGATTLPSSFDSLSVIKGMNYCNVDKIALSTPIDQIRRMLDKDLDIYQICQVAIGAPNTTKTKDVILQKAVMEEPEKHQKKAEDAMSDGSRKDILSKNFNTQNVSPKKRMAILLTYSEDANDMIPELLKRFWDAGIGVVSEHGLRGKGFFETSFRASWESFFKQTKFVVPIITSKYTKDIKKPSVDNLQSRGVKFIYELYTSRFINDSCLNHSVRPLVVENVPLKLLRSLNPVLETRWKMPKELDSFFDMMKNYACDVS